MILGLRRRLTYLWTILYILRVLLGEVILLALTVYIGLQVTIIDNTRLLESLVRSFINRLCMRLMRPLVRWMLRRLLMYMTGTRSPLRVVPVPAPIILLSLRRHAWCLSRLMAIHA